MLNLIQNDTKELVYKIETNQRFQNQSYAITFLNYMRTKNRKCKDDFSNKVIYKTCTFGLSEREDNRASGAEPTLSGFKSQLIHLIVR